MFRFLSIRAAAMTALSVFVFSAAILAADEIEWRPVSPAELAMTKPMVDPDADAEAIFWEVTLDDKKSSKMTLYHYVRVKIFTERGRERFSKFDIPFSKRVKIENVAARVIKPDGTIVDLQPGDIFEREILRAGKIKVNAKSFAVPGIEPGVIVEYQYEEARRNDSVSGERLLFQRDIPMQKVSYYLRPYKGTTLQITAFNMSGDTRFLDAKDKKGFQVLTRYNVPAIKDEPYMPPDDEVRRWVYLKYSTFGTLFQWGLLSAGSSEAFDDLTKPNKEIRRKAEALAAGAATEEEKLRRLYDFTQKQIRNLTFDSSLSEDERDKIKLKDADDVLKQSAGTAGYIDYLFASLARALDFDTNLVFSGDRSEQFFNPDKYKDAAFVHPCCIAVKVGGKWQYFNPGSPYLPFGKLVWYEEDAAAMLVSKAGYIWMTTPLTEPEESLAKRTARLKLTEEGELEGTVRIEYSGHQAIVRRMNGWSKSESKREEEFLEDFKEKINGIQITKFAIQNFTDVTQPLVYTFDVKVPNYAQKTGKRIFVKPGFFESGAKPVFTSESRNYDIYFPYPWAENDDIEIIYPEGYDLENAESPGEVAERDGITRQTFNLSIEKSARRLIYARKFHFGKGSIFFKAQSYPALKKMFDMFSTNDQDAVTLRKIEAQ